MKRAVIFSILVMAVMLFFGIWRDPSSEQATQSTAGRREPKAIEQLPELVLTVPVKVDGVEDSDMSSSALDSDDVTESPVGEDAIPGERVVSFNSKQDMLAFLKSARDKGLDVLSLIDRLNSVRVRIDDPVVFREALGDVSVRSGKNYYIRLPEDPPQTPLAATSHIGFGAYTLAWLGVRADNSAWGAGVTVAVLDSGVGNHPSLAGSSIERITVLKGKGAGAADKAHGTAMTSLILANDEFIGGLAPSADVLSVQVMGADGVGDTFTLAEGIVTAVDGGAKVLNISLGTPYDSFVLAQAVAYAVEHGVAIVAAAGNESIMGVNYPARYRGVIAVGGVDAVGAPLYFSNRGPEIDIAAPGIGINAAGADGGVTAVSGTSPATAIVSGALASVLSHNPGISVEDAIEVMLNNANDTGAPGQDDRAGAGILNLARIENRDQEGLYDIAACSPYVIRDDDGNVTVSVFFENRGTEDISKIEASATVAGQDYYIDYYNVEVGGIRVYEIRLDRDKIADDSGVEIRLDAVIDGQEDSLPGNNSVKGRILSK